MNPSIADYWPAFLSALHVLAAVAVTVDAVLRKRHVPSIIGWVGVAWLAPLVGSVLYYLLGINRIRRSAMVFRLDGTPGGATAPAAITTFMNHGVTMMPTIVPLKGRKPTASTPSASL